MIYLNKKLSLAILLISSTLADTTVAASSSAPSVKNDAWSLITLSDDSESVYSVKNGSYEVSTTKGGTSIALIVGQVENKKSKTFKYNKWYVSTNDCEAGLGKLVILNASGEYESETGFAANGSNVASGIADFICGIYQYNLKEKQNKGL